jgi:hypothetical protein
MYNLHIDMEPYELSEEVYKILCDEGDPLDIFNYVEYDDYECSGDYDYE